jgi:hypothetical protein
MGELRHVGQDTFVVRWNERSLNADAYVTYELNAAGGIGRMRMAAISAETDTSFDFQDLHFTRVSADPPSP